MTDGPVGIDLAPPERQDVMHHHLLRVLCLNSRSKCTDSYYKQLHNADFDLYVVH